MRKALIVGINYYQNVKSLSGCINDAYSVKGVLERHADGAVNFGTNLTVATDALSRITRKMLKDNVEKLFRDDSDIAFFYFSGHGYLESTGGYLLTSECNAGDEGLPMNELLTIANKSPARHCLIVIDCCHSGQMGTPEIEGNKAILREGMTILTASSADQFAVERNGAGIFTSLLVDALNGSAANLVGDVTPGSIYAHIDQSLGPWEQRPIFKTNVKSFTTLRKAQPPIALLDLKMITNLFEDPTKEFELNPSYESTSNSPNAANVAKFTVLQKFNRVNLVTPVDEEHMYYAAMNSKACKLTVLGSHYWNLVKNGRI